MLNRLNKIELSMNPAPPPPRPQLNHQLQRHLPQQDQMLLKLSTTIVLVITGALLEQCRLLLSRDIHPTVLIAMAAHRSRIANQEERGKRFQRHRGEFLGCGFLVQQEVEEMKVETKVEEKPSHRSQRQ